MKPVVSRFIENLMLDLFPQTPAELTDFGLDISKNKPQLYACYQWAVRQGKVSPEELNEAVGNGPQLTALLQRVDPNIVVKTMWDQLDSED